MYKSNAWSRKSKRQLAKEPLCAGCKHNSLITPALVSDHIIPHKGDYNLFWRGALQSLCLRCHGLKTNVERQGKLIDWVGRRVLDLRTDQWSALT